MLGSAREVSISCIMPSVLKYWGLLSVAVANPRIVSFKCACHGIWVAEGITVYFVLAKDWLRAGAQPSTLTWMRIMVA